jgi:hypothetical protein
LILPGALTASGACRPCVGGFCLQIQEVAMGWTSIGAPFAIVPPGRYWRTQVGRLGMGGRVR